MHEAKVFSIDRVTLIPMEGKTQGLIVTAVGTVLTKGYKNPYLLPRFDRDHPPRDGIYDFDFMAEFEDTLYYDKHLVLDAYYSFHEVPADLTIVRVYSETNVKGALCNPQHQPR